MASSTATKDTAPEPSVAQRAAQSLETLRRNKTGVTGLAIVGVMVLAIIVGPWVLNVDPNVQFLGDRLLPPFSTGEDGMFHLLGTDTLGRDVLARILAGGRASLSVVAAGILIGGGIGMVIGLSSGYYGGWADVALMRLVDGQLAVPQLMAALVVATILGGGFLSTALTLGISTWAIYARLVRAEALKIREQSFFESAVSLGARGPWIVGRHLIPNILGTVCVVASLEMGVLVITEASLSYLGMGLQPPNASWGSMIQQAQPYIFTDAWLAAIPGIVMMVMVLGLNLTGDWLRDVLDPQANLE